MSDSRRPLDPEVPYYKWGISDGSDGLSASLWIESECCADRFSPEEELVLLKALAERHFFHLVEMDKP
ncbi:hypothetical protein ACI7YT_12430 [Microbacterium sp. M]|uniref:hypothetical protein n=1 Tax=Microbacterium sp. M TaxID=3377125 RepID=UPI00386B089C